jgi:acetyltransferase-like isoleucine patch superfamily enzyme
MKHALRWALRKVLLRLAVALRSVESEVAAMTLPRFANEPKNLRFARPRRIYNSQHIHLGDDIIIGPGSFLKTVTQYPESAREVQRIGGAVQKFKPRLVLGNRVTATGALQISALDLIVIEDDVMFASNVFICDGFHGYEDIDTPFKDQRMIRISPIQIGRGCWIGQNVVVMPGVSIGEMSIIGANSVVTKSIPPRSIAVGSPARVTRRRSPSDGEWIPVDDKSSPGRA